MQVLKLKIKNTTLLSDEDKVAVLAAIDTYQRSDTEALGKIIDEFDKTHSQSVAEYKKNVYDVLDSIAANQKPSDAPRMKSSVDQIKSGIDSLLAPT